MNSKMDPMGRAIADYHKSKKASKLRVFSPMFEEAEKWAEELGFTTTVLESRDNKIHFYETMGYVADYSQKIVGETFTCYKMEKQLK